jgi:hypothetical protein
MLGWLSDASGSKAGGFNGGSACGTTPLQGGVGVSDKADGGRRMA